MIRKKSSLVKTAAALVLFIFIYTRLDFGKDELISGKDEETKVAYNQNRLGRVPQEDASKDINENQEEEEKEGTKKEQEKKKESGGKGGGGKGGEKETGGGKGNGELKKEIGPEEEEKKEVGEEEKKKREEKEKKEEMRKGEEEEDKKPVESLAGEREHGMPNVTNREKQKEVGSSDVLDILRSIQEVNNAQVILNVDLFGPVLNATLIIAVQVHNRIEYLRQLIASLSGARDIHKTLLIFSHDVWDEEINKLVRSIDFCMVLQIFYPFSLQTHQNTFPGESTRDCPRNAKVGEAAAMNCINKDWADIYGHYREAKFTQTKHHWWWKTNHIFNKLAVTRSFNGSVLYLEEDHFVAEDFLQVYRLMEEENKKLSNPANILCMGTYLKKFNYKLNSKQVELTQWMSSKHNMGMAISRATWNKIIQCKNHFCQYDDYNWDWSLLHVSLNCLKEKLQVMLVKGPRVFHIGECGVHHKKKDCASSLVMDKVKYIITSAQEYFYPTSLSVIRTNPRKKMKLKKGNGGWGDKRDHNLCLNISSSSVDGV